MLMLLPQTHRGLKIALGLFLTQRVTRSHLWNFSSSGVVGARYSLTAGRRNWDCRFFTWTASMPGCVTAVFPPPTHTCISSAACNLQQRCVAAPFLADGALRSCALLQSILSLLSRPLEPNLKKEAVLVMRRPDEWKDPWRRSKSPRRRPGVGSPPRGRRRHRPSGSSVSLSNSSRSELLFHKKGRAVPVLKGWVFHPTLPRGLSLSSPPAVPAWCNTKPGANPALEERTCPSLSLLTIYRRSPFGAVGL